MKKIKNGFTMIELVIVISILAILATFALPKVIDLRTKAMQAEANSIASSLEVAVSIAKAKSVANLASGKQSFPTLDLDDNPSTTDDVIKMSSLTKSPASPLSAEDCQQILQAFLPNTYDLVSTYTPIGVCNITNKNSSGYRIIFRPSANGTTQKITTIVYLYF